MRFEVRVKELNNHESQEPLFCFWSFDLRASFEPRLSNFEPSRRPCQNPPMTPSAPGRVIVISGPSGAGKSTLLKQLLERCDRLEPSVSATTRSPRPGEVD